jgi:multidrug resistance efflux pump
VQRTVGGFGTAIAEIEANVPAEVSSIVDHLPETTREGRRVQAGEVLLTLDPQDFQRQAEISAGTIADLEAQAARLEVEHAGALRRLELAEQDLVLARQELERNERARREGAAVEREVERARQALLASERIEAQVREELAAIDPRRRSLAAMMQMQRTNLRIAEQNVARCGVASPIEGILAAVDVKRGERVSIGQRVARVVNLELIEVPLMLPASARPFVSIGDRVLLERDADVSQAWEATVVRLAPIDDPTSRTFTAYAELRQDPTGRDLLVPGTFVVGRVFCGEPQERLVLPRRSIRDGRATLVVDGVVVSQPVSIAWTFEGELPRYGVPDSQWVVLDDPLPPGTLVMLDGNRTIAPGTAVEPVAASESFARPTAIAERRGEAAAVAAP